VLAPLFEREDPAALAHDELARRAEMLYALAFRLNLFATQRVRVSGELHARVRSLLARFADVPVDVRLMPGTPLCSYFNARCTALHTARALSIRVD